MLSEHAQHSVLPATYPVYTRQPPRPLNPLAGPKVSSSHTSALRDHLETSPGFPGIPEYGLSGPFEVPRPPRPIPILRPPQAQPRPEGHPSLSPPERQPGLSPFKCRACPSLPSSTSLSSACRESFEPHREQVRRHGITRSRHIPCGKRTGLRALRCPPLARQVRPDSLLLDQAPLRHRHSAQPNTRLHATASRSTPQACQEVDPLPVIRPRKPRKAGHQNTTVAESAMPHRVASPHPNTTLHQLWRPSYRTLTLE